MDRKIRLSPLRFSKGLRDGIPIGLGYLSVSFGFGISAVSRGLSALCSVLISMTNLTSAGQVAGLAIMAAGGSLLEMFVNQLIINMRYALMGISLTQKLDDTFNTVNRMLVSFFITDEIFAVASSKDSISAGYMYGLGVMPYIGWASGTLLGAVAGELLPASVSAALGLAIYGMFVAIVVPAASKSRGILLCSLIAAGISCCLKYIPLFSFVTQGFSIIICAVLAASTAALLFPVKEDKDDC